MNLLPVELVGNILTHLYTHEDALASRFVWPDIVDQPFVYKQFRWLSQPLTHGTYNYIQYYMSYRKHITYISDIKQLIFKLHDQSIASEFLSDGYNFKTTPVRLFNVLSSSIQVRSTLTASERSLLYRKIIIAFNLYENTELSNEYTVIKLAYMMEIMYRHINGDTDYESFKTYYDYGSPYVAMYKDL